AALVGVALAILLARRLAAHGSAGSPPHRAMRRIAAAATIAAAVIAWPIAVRLAGDGALRIFAIDVGQGDALAVRTPAGRWIVIDAGPRTDRFDAGRARVVPFLLQHGARRIDLLVLTHPHADHIGGAQALFEAFDVAAVVDPAVPAAYDLYLGTLAAARAEESRWLAAREGRVLRVDDVVLEFLAPDSASLDARDDPNDYSVVFRLSFGRFRALFLGDAPEAVEEAIVAEHRTAVASQVIKVGHHGSRTSTGEALLEAAAPGIALVSVGERNRYGHPDPGVMARLARRGVRILRTDQRGTVTLRATAEAEIELLTSR
ncbi:MAG: ComEC/Rec2 family competence protein, partial [Longimicrobiales bacterium]